MANTRGWFAVPTLFLSMPPVERLGVKFGPAGPVTLFVLMSLATQTGRVGETIRQVRRTVFVESDGEITNILREIEAVGAGAELSIDGDRFSIRLLQPFVTSRRRDRVPGRVRSAVLARDGRRCGICGGGIQPGEPVHLDHIIPWSKGGSNDVGNLQPAHPRCNMRKGARA